MHSFHIRTGHINSLINLYPTLGFFLRIKRSKGIHLRPQRLPVTVRILAAILCTLPQVVHNEHDLWLHWANCTIAFFGFCGISELLGTAPPLTPVNISFQDSRLSIYLHFSKTDRGCHVIIGCSFHSICAVQAMADYVAVAGSRLAKDCSIFWNIDGKPVTQQTLTDIICSCLEASSIPVVDRYATHSFCIGAATTAAQQM